MSTPQFVREVVFCAIFLASCAPSAVDTTPPEAIEDLSASAISPHAIRLMWTASGDDLDRGTASNYDIRYATKFITAASFDTLPHIEVDPPRTVGTIEDCTIPNLIEGTTYYFAIKVTDEAANPSELSNVASAITLPDTTAPAAIHDLSYLSVGPHSAVLAWTAPGDDGYEGRALRYSLRRSRNPITEDNWGAAGEIISPSTPPLAGSRDSVQVSNLSPETVYYFAIKTIDDFGNVSAMSNTLSFETTSIPRLPKTWIVKKDGSGSATSIQAAIDSSLSGDEVQVYPGIYYEVIDYKGKNIYIRSLNGPSETIIDGLGLESAVVSFRSGESNNATLLGFTLRHGVGSPSVGGSTYKYGGGIYIIDSEPSIIANIIEDNGDTSGPVPTNTFSGGGIFCDTPRISRLTRPLFRSNVIRNNSAMILGGGIATLGLCSPFIDANEIYSNHAGDDGGGIYISLSSSREAIIVACNIHHNVAQDDHGGGIYVAGTTGSEHIRVAFNTIWSNVADGNEVEGLSGSAMYFVNVTSIITNNTLAFNASGADVNGGAIALRRGVCSVSHNIISFTELSCAVACSEVLSSEWISNLLWANSIEDQCGSCGVVSDIYADPMFCDAMNGDFALKPGSPALLGSGTFIGSHGFPGCTPQLGASLRDRKFFEFEAWMPAHSRQAVEEGTRSITSSHVFTSP